MRGHANSVIAWPWRVVRSLPAKAVGRRIQLPGVLTDYGRGAVYYRGFMVKAFTSVEAHDRACLVTDCPNRGSEGGCFQVLATQEFNNLVDCSNETYKMVRKWMIPEMGPLCWALDVLPKLQAEDGFVVIDDDYTVAACVGDTESLTKAKSNAFVNFFLSQLINTVFPGAAPNLIVTGRVE